MELSESRMRGYVRCFLDATKKKSQEVHNITLVFSYKGMIQSHNFYEAHCYNYCSSSNPLNGIRWKFSTWCPMHHHSSHNRWKCVHIDIHLLWRLYTTSKFWVAFHWHQWLICMFEHTFIQMFTLAHKMLMVDVLWVSV